MDSNRRHPLLIVDDEPDVLDSLRHLFHRRFEVLIADNGPEAIRILESRDIHIILSDQRMPGMTGDELLHRAQQIQPDAIRLLFTGYADIQAVIDAVNRGGIYRYIHKPWEPLELEAVLNQAAKQYDLLYERRQLIAELRAANEHLKTANLELAESDQLKTAFLEVASHEFNTPITILRGMAELLLLMPTERSDAEKDILRQLCQSSRYLAKLVGNTLRLLEAGRYREPLQRQPTDLSALLLQTIEQLLPFARARKQKVEIAIAEDLGVFSIDAEKIRDAITHVLTNAIKFTPDGGDIRFAAHLLDPDLARIEVADRGIGLDPRSAARLFQPFFTEFDPSHHSSGDFGFNKRGLGLGLSVSKKFIELHGGRIEAESCVGEGTLIRVDLPRADYTSGNLDVEFPGKGATETPTES
jgi:signal transduction histidine kinase